MKLRIGFKACTCDDGCLACEHTSTVPYWQPPRWVEILAVIVAKTDMSGGFQPGARWGTYVEINGYCRSIPVEEGWSDGRSLKTLARKDFISGPDSAWLYYPTTTGREALKMALEKFERIAAKRGQAPRRLT